MRVINEKDGIRGETKLTTRLSWDEIWMNFTRLVAKRSYDPRHKVGAIVVTGDNTQVLSIGYNGNYAGGPNEIETIIPGQSGMIHAEINTLIKLDYNNPKYKKMYLTLSPCRMCAKAIINGGINEVIYDKEYRDTSGIHILEQIGIKLRKYK